MNPIIIGTAGHVDHGKTLLVKKLTGIDTDRLKEEKERGISIELGFAQMTLPNGRRVAFIDVPGHERFIKQMLAGVGGIDLVLLVIAADEGVMPQTREHLDILNLLKIQKGIIVITKVDLVDHEWMQLVISDVKDAVKGSFLEGAFICEVSSVTGSGLDQLVRKIEELSEEIIPKSGQGIARLPVDRVFSITGFGTVVTGTLFSGKLKVGDSIEILPEGITTRIRNLQVHGEKVTEATAGQRVAVNLAGVEVEQIGRGSVLLTPGALEKSFRIDARLELLPHSEKELKNNARIRFYLGTKETLGRVILLDRDRLLPGEAAYGQIVFEEEIIAVAKDRFVLRTYSPMFTIGGGVVLHPNARKRKRFKQSELDEMAVLEKGSPKDQVEQTVANSQRPLTTGEINRFLNFKEQTLTEILEGLTQEGRLKRLIADQVCFVTNDRYKNWLETVIESVAEVHREFPLRRGILKEELRTKKFPKLNQKLFNSLVQSFAQEGDILIAGQYIALSDFNWEPDPESRKVIDKILDIYLQSGTQPPNWTNVKQQVKFGERNSAEEYLDYLVEKGDLVKLADEIYYHDRVFQQAKEKVREFLRHNPELLLQDARELLNTSRRYLIPLLEVFDRDKVTKRIGDKRVLW